LAFSAVTISPNGLTINGVATNYTLQYGGTVNLWSDGSNYFTAMNSPGSNLLTGNFANIPGLFISNGGGPLNFNSSGPTGLTVEDTVNMNGLLLVQDGAGNHVLSVNVPGAGSGGRVVFGPSFNNTFHLENNPANNDYAGVLTCAAGTVSKTFTAAWTSTPTIVVSDETTAGGARVSAKSATAFTVTCTGATDVVDYIVIGNPN